MRAERHARLVGAMNDAGRRRAAPPRPVERRRTRPACACRRPTRPAPIHRRPVAIGHRRRTRRRTCGRGSRTVCPPTSPRDHVHAAGLSLEWDEGARLLARRVAAGTAGRRRAHDAAARPRSTDAARRRHGDRCRRPRSLKTPDELECIRRASEINEAAIADVATDGHAGHARHRAHRTLPAQIFELGASGNTVDPIWQVMPTSIADGPYTDDRRRRVPDRDDRARRSRGRPRVGRQRDLLRGLPVGLRPHLDRRPRSRRATAVAVPTLARCSSRGARGHQARRDGARPHTRRRGARTARRPWLAALLPRARHRAPRAPRCRSSAPTSATSSTSRSVLAPGMVLVLEPIDLGRRPRRVPRRGDRRRHRRRLRSRCSRSRGTAGSERRTSTDARRDGRGRHRRADARSRVATAGTCRGADRLSVAGHAPFAPGASSCATTGAVHLLTHHRRRHPVGHPARPAATRSPGTR